MTQNIKSVDTLVIGGGLVGAALAWGLARAGQRVIVLDEGDVALRASRGNFGLVWVQSKGERMPEYSRWTRQSADVWPAFSQELADQTGISVDYTKPGGIHFLLSEDALDAKRQQIARMHNHYGALQSGVEMLDRDELIKLMPGLGPDVLGGSYCPHDGHVSPLKLLRALHAGLARQGAQYIADARVERVARDGSGFVATTAKGAYRGAQIVLAAGHGNTWLAPSLGLDVPLIPEKGQILVTERAAPLMPMPTHLLRQTAEGTIMIGDSHEDTGYSTDSTTPVIAQLARSAQRCFPSLGQLRVIRSWGAVRVLSPDGCPIYQESETHPGAYSINCHSGVTLAGAHALKLAPLLAQGHLSPEFDVFHSRRFADGTTQNTAH